MKRKLAIALCLIGLLGICKEGIAGSVDNTSVPVGNEDGLLGPVVGSGSWELETLVPPRARVEKTGQTISYGPRDDGKLRKGVAWPVPRFMDNANGTVRDNLTGLTWLRNANCSVFYAEDTISYNGREWNSALLAANNLKDGFCGLTDGSVAGNWRLPNKEELESLVDYGFDSPAISNTAGTGKWTERDPFTNVQSSYYWSSTADATFSDHAWRVSFSDGDMDSIFKTSPFGAMLHYVWPVR